MSKLINEEIKYNGPRFNVVQKNFKWKMDILQIYEINGGANGKYYRKTKCC